MLSLSNTPLRLGAIVLLGIAAGFLYLFALPVISRNSYFLFALPAVMIVLLIMVLDIHKMLALVLYTRLLLEPLANASRIGGSGMGVGAIMNLFVIVVGSILILANFEKFKKVTSLGSWLIFLTLCFMGIAYTPGKPDGFRLFMNYLSYMMLFASAFVILKEEKDFRFWVKTLLFSSTLPVLYANFDLAKGGQFYSDAGMRIHGTFTHPNILAFYLVMLLVLLFYIYQTRMFQWRGVSRTVICVYAVDLFVLLLATKTRSAWLSLWTVFFIFGLLKSRKYLLWVILLPILVVPFSSSARERVSELFSSHSSRKNSLSWRVELWKQAIPEIKKSPIFGHGLASFVPLSKNFFKDASKTGVGAHNIYIQTAFELGFLGLLAFLSIFAGIFLELLRRRGPPLSDEDSKGRLILATFILLYMVVGASDNMLYYLAFNWYFFFLIGLLLAGIKLKSAQSQNLIPRKATSACL